MNQATQDRSSRVTTMSLEQFINELKAQGVPRVHVAFKCVVCGTVQSMQSLILAGAGETEDEVEKYIGFSCVGRWKNAGSHVKGTPPGKGCNWTLGGLFTIHKLEVIDEEGKAHPRFELASQEEAQELMRQLALA